MKKTRSRRPKRKCFSSDRVGGAGMLLIFFYPVKRNLVDY